MEYNAKYKKNTFSLKIFLTKCNLCNNLYIFFCYKTGLIFSHKTLNTYDNSLRFLDVLPSHPFPQQMNHNFCVILLSLGFFYMWMAEVCLIM